MQFFYTNIPVGVHFPCVFSSVSQFLLTLCRLSTSVWQNTLVCNELLMCFLHQCRGDKLESFYCTLWKRCESKAKKGGKWSLRSVKDETISIKIFNKKNNLARRIWRRLNVFVTRLCLCKFTILNGNVGQTCTEQKSCYCNSRRLLHQNEFSFFVFLCF